MSGINEEELEGIAAELGDIPKPTVSYDKKKEALTIQEDLDSDGTPDITIKVRVGAIVRKAWKPAVAGIIMAALGYALHMAGVI